MISCEQAATICNKSQYKEASWKERLQLYAHLLVCKTCAGFSRRNKKLTQLCSKAEINALSDTEKEALKSVIQRAKE